MKTQQIVWNCTCDKCSHKWITKGYDLPFVCSKCKSKLWDKESDPDKVEEITPTKILVDPLTAFIAKAQALKGVTRTIDVEPEPVIDQWQGWTAEQTTYDDQTGDTRTYRKHIKSGRIQWINAQSALLSV